MRVLVVISVILLAGCGGAIFDTALSGNLEPVRVYDLQVETSGSTATVRFTANLPASYQLVYGLTNGAYTAQTSLATDADTLHTILVTNLQSDVTYYARVRASAPGRESAESAQFTFTTASSNSIGTISSSNVTNTSAVIGWRTARPSTHLVEYGTASGTYTLSTLQSSTASTNHAVSLTGLAQGTPYYYRVWCFTTADGPIVSAEKTFTTVAEPTPTAAQRARGIWVVGGLSTGAVTSAIARVDLYDPPTATWYKGVTTLSNAVSFAGVVGLNGKLYVMGGFDATGAVVNTVQIFDTVTKTWLPGGGAGITLPRANIHAVAAKGLIYLLGGTTGNANAAWAGSATTYMYTPNAGIGLWGAKVAFAGNHSNRLTYVYDDVVYNLGGKSATSTLVATHDGVALTANALTTGATEVVIPAVRAGMSGALYQPSDGPAVLILVGGFSALANTGCYVFNTPTAGTPLNTVNMLRYPFVAPSTMLVATVLPASLGFGSAAIYQSTLYHFGGTGYPAAPTTAVYSYNLTSGTAGSWTTLPSMDLARMGHAAVTAY